MAHHPEGGERDRLGEHRQDTCTTASPVPWRYIGRPCRRHPHRRARDQPESPQSRGEDQERNHVREAIGPARYWMLCHVTSIPPARRTASSPAEGIQLLPSWVQLSGAGLGTAIRSGPSASAARSCRLRPGGGPPTIVVFVDAFTRPEDERLLELLRVSACSTRSGWHRRSPMRAGRSGRLDRRGSPPVSSSADAQVSRASAWRRIQGARKYRTMANAIVTMARPPKYVVSEASSVA